MAKDLNGKELPEGIIQRPNGEYMGRFRYGGKRYYVYDRDLKNVIKKMNERRYEVEHGQAVKNDKINVDDWFNIWLNVYKINSLKKGTYQEYQNDYRLYIKKKLGKLKVKDVRSDQIQAIYNELKSKGYSDSTINTVSTILSGMFKKAWKDHLIPFNPVENTDLPKKNGKKKEPRVLTVEEQELFMQYAKESPYYYLYIVALGTGMRSGELRAMEWSDVDFGNRIIHVTGTLKYYSRAEGFVKEPPKNAASERDIPMIEAVYNALMEQQSRQSYIRNILEEAWQPREGLENLVFTTEYHRKAYGIPICSSGLNTDVKKIVQQINDAGNNFKKMSPHAFRHTFATRGLEKGIPAKVMQELLGHTSIKMTMDIYSHVLPDTKANEIKKLDSLF